MIRRIWNAAIARRYTPPQGANITPITQDVINQMYASLAPQGKTQGMYSPGAPLRPVDGITPAQGPRQWQYPIGYNIGQLPRSTELNSFSTLRNLAMLYDVIGLCERAWFDLCSKPELQIKPKVKFLTDSKGDPIDPQEVENKYGARIATWEDFFAKPDKKRSLKQWMRMALRDMLEIDALAIFKHANKGGGLWGLELIDGSTIKPLLDERGMAPIAPYPAYQQFVYGVPGELILADDLIYRRETERTDSPYGLSRVERIILRVNQALRKQNKDLSTFTDGNMPAGTLEPPDDGTTDWTPEQLLAYQEMWDGMLAGNDSIKARIKVIPPGAKFNKTDPDDIMVQFDQFLMNVTVAAFGLTMSELGFTENVNKSSGDTQEAVIYRRTMSPIMDMFGEMFTDVMAEQGETDLYATWKAFEEPEDFKTKVEAWNVLVTNGTQSTSQAATALGLKPMVETEPFVLVQGQGPVFLSDMMDPQMREQAKQAKLAGYQQAQNPEQQPGQGQGQGSDDQSDDDVQSAIDEADKAFGGGGSSQQRFDPVHAYHGEFGTTGTTPTHGSGHHKGHHKKSTHPRHKYTASQRMQRLAARFTKLENSKHLDARERAAAGKMAGFFTQLAADITRGGQQQAIDGLFDQVWAQAKILWSDKPRSLAAMARSLTRLDNLNDRGKLRAVMAEDEEWDEQLDALEEELDDEQEPQQQAQGTESTLAGETGASGRAAPGTTQRGREPAQDGGGDDAIQATRDTDVSVQHQSGDDTRAAVSAELRRWRECAIKDVKAGKPIREFVSDIIPSEEYWRIHDALRPCVTADQVRAVFRGEPQEVPV